MTLCIAWNTDDSIILAADSRVVTSEHGLLEDQKIFEAGLLTVAFAGDVAVEHCIRHLCPAYEDKSATVPAFWARSVKPEIDKTFPQGGDVDYQLIITDGCEVYVSMDGYLRKATRAFTAIGSAAAYAYGHVDGSLACASSDMAFPLCSRSDVADLFDAASAFDEKVGNSFGMQFVYMEKTKKKAKRGRKG